MRTREDLTNELRWHQTRRSDGLMEISLQQKYLIYVLVIEVWTEVWALHGETWRNLPFVDGVPR